MNARKGIYSGIEGKGEAWKGKGGKFPSP